METRLRHRLSQAFEYSLSGAACSTDGWESRVYAYSLSFPGQFGSSALYNKAVLLQAAVSVHISPNAVLRGKYSWYSMQGEESLGTGYEETPGSSRNAWGFSLTGTWNRVRKGEEMRPSWDQYFLKLAMLASERATCPRMHCGCVLVRHKHVLATGYNGSLPGLPHCDDIGCLIVNDHCIRTNHAEMNAITQAAKNGVSIAGATAM